MRVKLRVDKQTLRNLLRAGLTKKGLALALSVCRRTLYRWLNKPIDVPRKRGRPPRITEMVSSFLLDVMRSNPCYLQKDLAQCVWKSLSVKVHQSTVSRFLKSVEWTRKKVTPRPDTRTEGLAKAWLSSLDGVGINDLIALDETAFVTTNVQQSHGYAPKGKLCVSPLQMASRNKRDRITLLVCIQPGSNQPLHHKIVTGSMTGPLFQDFIATLPENCRGKRLLLDNAAIHHSTHVCRKQGLPTIQETAEAKGITLHYLPPYSPQYNPTELVFAQLKKLVRFEHHCRVTPGTLSDRVVMALGGLTAVPSMFRHCLRWLC
jgi:transposase